MTDGPVYSGEDVLIFDTQGISLAPIAIDGLYKLTGVEDIVPGMTDLSVRFDPAVIEANALIEHVRALAEGSHPPEADASAREATVLTLLPPAGYADDRAMLANALAISHKRLHDWLTGQVFRVSMMGFQPGFAYLDCLAPDVPAIPRLAEPRPKVPAGSIGFLGTKACIYSLDGPGGWPIIARVAERMFAPEKPAQPFRLGLNEHIRFQIKPE